MPKTGVSKISYRRKTLAIVYRGSKLHSDGVTFLTPNEYPLQVGLLHHKEGKSVPSHYHPHLRYNVTNTQEFLYVEKGTMEVTIYTINWRLVKKIILYKADFILLVDCGHSVVFGKNTRVIEIKQGPYPGKEKSKKFKQ